MASIDISATKRARLPQPQRRQGTGTGDGHGRFPLVLPLLLSGLWKTPALREKTDVRLAEAVPAMDALARMPCGALQSCAAGGDPTLTE